MRKFMSDSNANRQKASKSVVSGTATPKKRARGTKAEVKKEVCEIADKDENDDVGSDATISDVETPTKRVKGEYWLRDLITLLVSTITSRPQLGCWVFASSDKWLFFGGASQHCHSKLNCSKRGWGEVGDSPPKLPVLGGILVLGTGY